MNPLTKPYLETTTATFSLPLPVGGKAVVKKGSPVAADQTIIKGEEVTLKEYNLTKTLGVPGKKIISLLVKSLGSRVVKGELIAKRARIFGKKQFISPIDGTLESLSEEGVLRIKVAEREYEIKTPLAGRVTSTDKNKTKISFSATKVVGIWGAGGQAFGPLILIGSQENGATIFDLKGDFKGTVVAFSGPLTLGFWHKAVSLAVSGIVCGKLPSEQFRKMLEKEFLRVSGKTKRIALPLLVVGEGKEGRIREEIWQVLRDAKQMLVVIKGEEMCLLIPRKD